MAQGSNSGIICRGDLTLKEAFLVLYAIACANDIFVEAWRCWVVPFTGM